MVIGIKFLIRNGLIEKRETSIAKLYPKMFKGYRESDYQYCVIPQSFSLRTPYTRSDNIDVRETFAISNLKLSIVDDFSMVEVICDNTILNFFPISYGTIRLDILRENNCLPSLQTKNDLILRFKKRKIFQNQVSYIVPRLIYDEWVLTERVRYDDIWNIYNDAYLVCLKNDIGLLYCLGEINVVYYPHKNDKSLKEDDDE